MEKICRNCGCKKDLLFFKYIEKNEKYGHFCIRCINNMTNCSPVELKEPSWEFVHSVYQSYNKILKLDINRTNFSVDWVINFISGWLEVTTMFNKAREDVEKGKINLK